MKKILLGTIILTAFSLSIILFQLSCKKSANASPSTSATIQQQNKIIFKTRVSLNTSLLQGQLWSCNYDGSNKQMINITLPTGKYVAIDGNVQISPDQKTLFFEVEDSSSYPVSSWSCNIDGSNPKQIFSDSSETIQIAY